MMQFLQSIVDFFAMIVDFVASIVDGILTFFMMIPSYVTFLTASVGFMPDILIPFIMLGVFISVLFIIIGR